MPRAPKRGIGRSIFGYRRSAVQQLLVERDFLQRAAEGRLLAAESRVAELESDLSEMRDGLQVRDEALHQLETELEAFERSASEKSPRMLSREVDAILVAAQETASRIVSRARSVSRREARDLASEVQADVARLVAWREEALPAIRQVEANLRDVKESVQAFGRKLSDAIEPLERLPLDGVNESLSSIGASEQVPMGGDLPRTRGKPRDPGGPARAPQPRPRRRARTAVPLPSDPSEMSEAAAGARASNGARGSNWMKGSDASSASNGSRVSGAASGSDRSHQADTEPAEPVSVGRAELSGDPAR